MKQLLLRGCSLQNTDYVYGIVVYTGHETKIMLNSKQAPSKSSNVLKKMNKILYTVFLFQLILCMVLAGLSVNWQQQDLNKNTYLSSSSSNLGFTYFIQVLTYLVAYSHLIPISLYVALELVKLGLSFYINQDVEMYHEKPANCRASDLVEELGQVEFIFSDKTGTLTSNEMEFRKCEVDGRVYGNIKNKFGSVGSEEFEILKNTKHSDYNKMRRFFEFMAVCHSVFPATMPGSDKIVYQAASPDELALVEASKSVGFTFYDRSEGKVKLKIMNNEETAI